MYIDHAVLVRSAGHILHSIDVLVAVLAAGSLRSLLASLVRAHVSPGTLALVLGIVLGPPQLESLEAVRV